MTNEEVIARLKKIVEPTEEPREVYDEIYALIREMEQSNG